MIGQQQSNEETILLLDQARAGDQDAFALLYKEYYTPIYRFIYFRVKSKEEAEDLAQTVFLKVYATLSDMQGETTAPRAFFFTVARNAIIDHYRKQSYRNHSGEEAMIDIADDDVRPDEARAISEETDRLKQAISQLTKEQQEVIILKFINELETKEIAQAIGKREDAVRQIQSRAIKALRKILDGDVRF